MARIIRACRGDGVAYVEIAGAVADGSVLVRTAEGNRLPGALIPLCGNSLAVAFPLARTDRFSLEGGEGAGAWSLSLPSFELKLRSKIAYALQPKAAARLRDCDVRESAPCIAVRFIQAVEGDEGCVVRASVDVPSFVPGEVPVRIEVLDAFGAPSGQKPIIMEDCAEAVDERGRAVRRITLALQLPLDAHCVGVAAFDPESRCHPGGCMLLDDTYAALRGGFIDASMDASRDPAYHQWFERHRATEDDVRQQAARTFGKAPRFSIVVPLYRTPIGFFDAMYGSVAGQSYADWELLLVNASPDDAALKSRLDGICDKRVRVLDAPNEGIAQNTNVGIKASTGDYLCFLDHDDALAPDALFEYARVVEAHPDADLLYCDEDRFDAAGMHAAPFFKPDYSPELLRAHNYVTHLLCVSRTCVEKIGLMDPAFNGAQDYDYTLKAVEQARRVVHVPRVLYHWRLHEASTSMNPESKAYAKDAGLRALQAHCDRMGFKAVVERTGMPFAYRVVHEPRDWGCVDIVIPSKDHCDLLRTCVESILERCTYRNYRIIVVENNSTQAETFACYEELQAADSRVSVVTWPGEFNYSKVVNFGAGQGTSPFILFLNNDTEVIAPDFLDSMLGCFEDPGVGVVGAKLLFADGTVQHAGVGVGLLGAAAHLFASLPASAGGYFDRARLPQNLSAVTGACQLVRRSVYQKVGGYTEEFTVGYNDVDFCLKVGRAGLRTVWLPWALLSHFEFASRGRDMRGVRQARAQQEAALLQKRWSEYFEQGDPYLNPNFSTDSCYLALGRD